MPGRPEDYLFFLVKSLSNSEWSTLHRFRDADLFRNDKKNKGPDKITEMIQAIAKLPAWDNAVLREQLGFTDSERDNQYFRKIKQRAEVKVLEAIEYAPANQTELVRMEKLAALLRTLEERGIYRRLDRLVKKYKRIAHDYEYFQTEKELLTFELRGLDRNYEGEARKIQLGAAYKRLELIYRAITEQDQLMLAREGLKATGEVNFEALRVQKSSWKDSWEQVYAQWSSARAQFLFAEIIANLFKRDRQLELAISPLEIAVKLYKSNQHWGSEPYFTDIYLLARTSLISILSYAGQKRKALKGMDQLESELESLSFHAQLTYQPRIWIARLYHLISQGEIANAVQIVEKAQSLFETYPTTKDRGSYLTYSYLAGFVHFLHGDLSNAVRWHYPLNTPRPLPSRPLLSDVVHIAMLVFRYEQTEFEALNRELKDARKYFKRRPQLTEAVAPILDFFKRAMSRQTFPKDHGKALIEYLASSKVLSAHLDYFPLREWLTEKIYATPMVKQIVQQSDHL